jgi:shikimate dehydrogenase
MRLFGLIGFPLGHSFSKRYFTEKFARESIHDAAYELFPIETIERFPSLWMEHPELQGLNVTIPYKESVIPYLDDCSEVVRDIGACNCIRKINGRLVGYNTDVTGFEQTLLAHRLPHQTRALVLGTGGAAKAVDYVLRKNGIKARHVSRSPGNQTLAYEALNASLIQTFPILINTTPLGMFPQLDGCPPIPYEGIGVRHLLIDLVYNPAVTRFMEKGMERGARVCNGEKMLIVQAEESWRIWNAA